MNNNGILIAFEGVDGAGKTTQVDLLGKLLQKAGQKVVLSKEPTDGEWGRKIRASAQTSRMPIDEELHAFIEDRKEHIKSVIAPSLQSGCIVILDRYFYSTIAYQGARGKPVDELIRSMEFAPRPDVVLMIDVEPELGLTRISHNRNEKPNEFEKVGNLTKAREIFLGLARNDSAIHLVNGSDSIRDVHRSIVHFLTNGIIKERMCAKAYGCDGMNCSFRNTGNCNWANIVAVAPSRFST